MSKEHTSVYIVCYKTNWKKEGQYDIFRRIALADTERLP